MFLTRTKNAATWEYTGKANRENFLLHHPSFLPSSETGQKTAAEIDSSIPQNYLKKEPDNVKNNFNYSAHRLMWPLDNMASRLLWPLWPGLEVATLSGEHFCAIIA